MIDGDAGSTEDAGVGANVGMGVIGISGVGAGVGANVGTREGAGVGTGVGAAGVGAGVGAGVACEDGTDVGGGTYVEFDAVVLEPFDGVAFIEVSFEVVEFEMITVDVKLVELDVDIFEEGRSIFVFAVNVAFGKVVFDGVFSTFEVIFESGFVAFDWIGAGFNQVPLNV